MEDRDAYMVLSIQRVLDIGTTYQAEINKNLFLKGLFTALAAGKVYTDSLILKLDTSSVSYTEASDTVRDEAAKNFSIIAGTISAYGIANNNAELSGFNRYTYSELRQSTLMKQLTDTSKILEGVNNNQTALTDAGIDSLLAGELQSLYTNMLQLTKVPQNVIDEHKNNRQLLKAYLKDERHKLSEQMDGAMGIYKMKNLLFYLAYTAARKVRHHHLKRKFKELDVETTTGILELLVLDKLTNEPLPGAQLLIASLNIVETFDEDGETYNDKIAPGSYQAKLFMEGYKDVEFSFVIEAGKYTTLQFVMEISN